MTSSGRTWFEVGTRYCFGTHSERDYWSVGRCHADRLANVDGVEIQDGHPVGSHVRRQRLETGQGGRDLAARALCCRRTRSGAVSAASAEQATPDIAQTGPGNGFSAPSVLREAAKPPVFGLERILVQFSAVSSDYAPLGRREKHVIPHVLRRDRTVDSRIGPLAVSSSPSFSARFRSYGWFKEHVSGRLHI